MLKLKNPILWVFAFPAGELVGRFKEKVSIYFCNDPHYLFAPAGKKREGIIKIEQELIKKVDFVFAVSHTLVEEKKVFNKSTHLIPHGVRIDLFNNAGSIVPTEYEQISSPRIGFVGVLGGKLDYELIDYVAERRGDWEIVLIGPVAEADQIHRQWIEKLKERPNVHFLGNKAPEELPNYIKALDVCLLPYKKSAFSRMFWVPLKFYEYLAAGRPIVSNVILRGAMEYDESVVRTTENRELFIEMIEKSLNNDSDELISKRKIIARNNSWQKRIDKIHSLVALNEK
ncbi:MAG: glycosyltransferase [Candidatus Margulisiibacteriota bacterium]|nr:glycosyltransferase [Candidatus Margulisiibacteriota bacterium]